MRWADKVERESSERRLGFRRLKREWLRETILEFDFSLDLITEADCFAFYLLIFLELPLQCIS